jgi:hypothetical protein
MTPVSSTALPAQRLLTDLLGLQQSANPNPKEARSQLAAKNASSDAASSAQAQATVETPSAESSTDTDVSLSTNSSSKANGSAPAFEFRLPAVFAEVWREGVKVAVIDANGGVKSLNGVVASVPGSSGAGGILLAARRAAEVAASTGGEIRVGGEPMDAQTLKTRAKLTAAYGASL